MQTDFTYPGFWGQFLGNIGIFLELTLNFYEITVSKTLSCISTEYNPWFTRATSREKKRERNVAREDLLPKNVISKWVPKLSSVIYVYWFEDVWWVEDIHWWWCCLYEQLSCINTCICFEYFVFILIRMVESWNFIKMASYSKTTKLAKLSS